MLPVLQNDLRQAAEVNVSDQPIRDTLHREGHCPAHQWTAVPFTDKSRFPLSTCDRRALLIISGTLCFGPSDTTRVHLRLSTATPCFRCGRSSIGYGVMFLILAPCRFIIFIDEASFSSQPSVIVSLTLTFDVSVSVQHVRTRTGHEEADVRHHQHSG